MRCCIFITVERGANGARVLNWYHRQFREAKHERYCVNDAQSKSLQGNLVDFFAGTWDNGSIEHYYDMYGQLVLISER
ncbi:hypothetical protein DPMN_002972 [Dreissena polymorpha]|uniref:Uncharacterized protein n=1 Tax=Dreissena polymorpha TaxID=45954 RepID=A0A9D4MP38_DREPO|nr:hypothetical protein DPMN_002972 [Dreissena polymorpha]